MLHTIKHLIKYLKDSSNILQELIKIWFFQIFIIHIIKKYIVIRQVYLDFMRGGNRKIPPRSGILEGPRNDGPPYVLF